MFFIGEVSEEVSELFVCKCSRELRGLSQRLFCVSVAETLFILAASRDESKHARQLHEQKGA
jgi:hypothetical protein